MELGTRHCVQKPSGKIWVGGFMPQMQIWILGRVPTLPPTSAASMGEGVSSLHPVSVIYPGWIRSTDLWALTWDGR